MKNLKMKKTYYVGVCQKYPEGRSYFVYSQTNNLKKALEDKEKHERKCGSYGVILVSSGDGKLYPLDSFDIINNRIENHLNYNEDIDDIYVIFKNINKYKFNGKNYVRC